MVSLRYVALLRGIDSAQWGRIFDVDKKHLRSRPVMIDSNVRVESAAKDKRLTRVVNLISHLSKKRVPRPT
jgi:hypothetical protein